MSETCKVIRTTYAIHRKNGAKPVISEYVCLDHKGFARKKAEAWWKKHSAEPVPNGYGLVNVDRGYWMAVYGALKKTTEVTVAQDEGGFRTITQEKIGSLPTEEEICDYLLPNK